MQSDFFPKHFLEFLHITLYSVSQMITIRNRCDFREGETTKKKSNHRAVIFILSANLRDKSNALVKTFLFFTSRSSVEYI